MPSYAAAGLFLALSAVWGSTWIANSLLAQTESPLHILVLRYGLGGLCAGLLHASQSLIKRRRRTSVSAPTHSQFISGEPGTQLNASEATPRFAILWAFDGPDPRSRQVMLVGVVLGCTMFAIPDLLLLWAASHGAAPWMPLLYAAMPLGLLLASGKLQPAAILAVGAMLIVLNGSLPLNPQKLAWAAPIAIAVALQGWSLVYARDHLAAASSPRGIMIQQLIASELIGIALRLGQEPRSHLPVRLWPLSSLGALCFLAIASTAIAYPLYYRLLSCYEPAQVATSAWLQTLVAVGESATLLHQRPGWPMIGAAAALLLCTGSLMRRQSPTVALQLER